MLALVVRRLLVILVALPLLAVGATVPSDVAGGPPKPPPPPAILDEVAASPLPSFAPADAADPSGCRRDPSGLPTPLTPEGWPANYLHTCGNRILDSRGQVVRIVGVNWYGIETYDYAPRGLKARNWQEILDQVAALGYNTIRLPFSNESLEPGKAIRTIDYSLNPDLQGLGTLEILDRLIAGARERGLWVILDRHRPTAAGQTELWYTQQVPESRWIADWRMLAARYAGNDTVIGVDLHNEPHGSATWGSGAEATDWRLAAERGSDAVLEVNPYLLVFVEGIENYSNDSYWWGGQLRGVRAASIRLQVPGRVVYSPRDYGPTVYNQSWFSAPDFPANLPGIWESHWGYIQDENIAPVVLGEFGGLSLGDDKEGKWQRALLAYVREHGMGLLVWSLNPNPETGGILADDWRTVESQKQETYWRLLSGPPADGAPGDPVAYGQNEGGFEPSRVRLLYRQIQTGDPTEAVSFAFSFVNEGPTPLDLSRLELRYWLTAGSLNHQEQLAEAGPSGSTERILTTFLPTTQGGQTHYLRVRFPPEAGAIGPYQAGGEYTVRFIRNDLSRYVQANDYSFADRASLWQRPGSWDRVGLYLDGRLVSGREP